MPVWTGLQGSCKDSGIKFIPGSHRYGKLIQQAAFEADESRDALEDERSFAPSRRLDPEAPIVQPAVADGEAVCFDGGIWHGSHNMSDARRVALLPQYARSSAIVRHPRQGCVVRPLEFEEILPPRFQPFLDDAVLYGAPGQVRGMLERHATKDCVLRE